MTDIALNVDVANGTVQRFYSDDGSNGYYVQMPTRQSLSTLEDDRVYSVLLVVHTSGPGVINVAYLQDYTATGPIAQHPTNTLSIYPLQRSTISTPQNLDAWYMFAPLLDLQYAPKTEAAP